MFKKKTSFDQLGGIKTGIKNHLKTNPINREELSKPEIFSLKTEIFFFFLIGPKSSSIDQILKKQKFFEKFGKFFVETFGNQFFMIWDACSWFQKFYKYNLSKENFNPKQISSNFSFLTPPKCIKHIKKLNLGWP